MKKPKQSMDDYWDDIIKMITAPRGKRRGKKLVNSTQVWAVLDKHFPTKKSSLVKSVQTMYVIMEELFGKDWMK